MPSTSRLTEMRVLVTGATGNTGSRVAAKLEDQGQVVRRASRHAAQTADGDRVFFDWGDPATHGPAVEGVDAIYLVPPVLVADPAPMMVPFVDSALAAGVRRFVLLSASVIAPGSPGVGVVHGVLRDRAPEWAVLQPSWFMQNFTGDHFYAESIRREDLIATSTGSGRVGFVDTDDIASVAVRALIDPEPHDTAHVITGPEALNYGEIAAIASEVAGRPVRHLRVDRSEAQRRLVAAGIPDRFAEILTDLERVVEEGAEDRVTDAVEAVTGHRPRSFREHAEASVGAWAPIADR
jgi:ergot alkaloid biosynthesis protein